MILYNKAKNFRSQIKSQNVFFISLFILAFLFPKFIKAQEKPAEPQALNHAQEQTQTQTPVVLHVGVWGSQLNLLPLWDNDNYFIITPYVFKTEQEFFKNIDSQKICILEEHEEINEQDVHRCLHLLRNQGLGEKPISYLVNGPSEDDVSLGAKLRTKFQVPHGLTEERASLFVDKLKMKQKLTAKNPMIPTARFQGLSIENQNPEEIFQHLNFPVIIKPTDGAGSRGIHILEDAKEVGQFLINWEKEGRFNAIVEEFIRGSVLRLDGSIQGGKLQALFPSIYEPSCHEYYNHGKPQIIYSDFHPDRQEAYFLFTTEVLAALEYPNGPFHLEAIRSQKDGRLYFLEVAARPGGSSEPLWTHYKFPYNVIFINAQLNRSTLFDALKPTLDQTYALLDCPTLPEAVAGKEQVLHEFSYDKESPYLTLCPHSRIPYADDKFVWKVPEKGVTKMGTFYFYGPYEQVLKEARQIKSTLKGKMGPFKQGTYFSWPPQETP
jgi:hypothetical protein